MKKAIVTGATGFIGSFLIRELIGQKVKVIAVVRKGSRQIEKIRSFPIKIVECNLEEFCRLPKLITDRDIDAVFHIAWQGVSDQDARDEKIQMQNLQSTLDLLEAMKVMEIKTFVGAGSLHEEEASIEMRENKPISNMGYMYKSAKLAAHWMGKAKAGSYGIRFFWPLINTYGEEETSERLVNMIIRKVFRNESPDLSEGKQWYDFVHVEDVAHALYLIAEKGVDGTNYVIGSGNARPLREYLEIVGQVANQMNGKTQVSLGFGRIRSNVVCLPRETFDISDLTKDTGFEPQISFREGIERTARWIKSNSI